MDDTRRRDLLLATVAASLLPTASWAADPAVAQPAAGGDASDGGGLRPGEAWAASWAASVQGPYPVGNPSAQPDQRFAFPCRRKAPRTRPCAWCCAPPCGGGRRGSASRTPSAPGR